MGRKALIAMSGGVDSSVAAFLMKQAGYDCVGVTMKLFQNEDAGVSRTRTCCSLDDVEDARSVARRLGILYYVFNFSEEFKSQVIGRFIAAYESGTTPNPCIDCNRYLKFDRLFQRARELGCEAVVTGHYARIEMQDDRYVLKKAVDRSKDQSYVLYSLTQEQLTHVRFPLGELSKSEVRSIAEAHGFCNAEKPDSQDICFVPDGDYAAFLERYTGKFYPSGDVLDLSGQVIGQHRGAVRYTIGQRKGLGLALNEPVYVCCKDMAANTVTVGPGRALLSRELWADDMNWISIDCLSKPMRAYAKIRYRQTEQPATVYPDERGKIRILFDKPQRAVTAGQAVVLYNGDTVVGGAKICKLIASYR
jgi:tRNA-specific 2-thiouridylase